MPASTSRSPWFLQSRMTLKCWRSRRPRPQGAFRSDAAGNPKPQAQRNVTDPDSHRRKGADGWIQANTGQLLGALIADAGYCSIDKLEACEEKGLDAYISTSRQAQGRPARPSRGRPPKDLNASGRMDRQLRSNAGQAIDGARKTIVEPVFGQIRGARGLDRFRLRGLEKVNGEWSLMATTQNLLKLFRVSLATA